MDVDEPLKRLANPDNIIDRTEQPTAYSASVEQGSELFQDLGDQYAGRFIAPSQNATDYEPTASGFTGAFMSGQGETFGDQTAFIGSVLNGQLQAGFVDGGGLQALGGNYIVNEDGQSIYGLSLASYFEATNGGETRRGFLGMNLPQGETVPAFSIVYTGPEEASIVTNGDFETGDLTGWADTDSAWAAETTNPYAGTYCALHDGTLGIFGGDLVQSGLVVAAGDVITVSFANRRESGILSGRMKVEFLNSTDGVLDTEYIYGATSSAWATFSQSFLAPATTATARITWESPDPFNTECIDNVVVYATDTLKELRFTDNGIFVYDNGVGTSIIPEYPQTVTLWMEQCVTTVTLTLTISSVQVYNLYYGPTAANANDGDEYFFQFVIQAGTYSIDFLGGGANSAGKMDVYIDDVLVSSGIDWYAAAAFAQNTTKTASSISLTSGSHIMKLKINGKNASSTDFRLFLTKITIKPSAYV